MSCLWFRIIYLLENIKREKSGENLIFITNPENNLHPHYQVELAKLFIYMCNTGLHLFITTNSDYIIKEFNTSIQAFRAKSKELKAIDIDKKYVLNPIRINGYELVKSGKKFLIQECDKNNQGIEYKSFDKVIDKMNSQQEHLLFLGDE